MDCTTILLIYDEKANIVPLTEDILKVYEENNILGDVLLVDDGSTDGSSEICDGLSDKHDRVEVVHHGTNKGRSYAIRTGFGKARGKVTILMDGDRQYDPKEIPKFLMVMREGWDVVSGNRTQRADNWLRRSISSAYNRWLIGRGLGLDVMDQNSGFKSFDTKKARKMEFYPAGFSGLHRFILPLAKIHGMRIKEIPINHFKRPSGRSYIRPYTVPFITIRDYRKFRKKYREKIEAFKKERP